MPAPDVAPRRDQRANRPVKGDLRERALVDVAEKLLVSGEFADASVADLAEAAGISRAGFYFYFGSKQALLARVIDRTVSEFNAEIAAVLSPELQQHPVQAVRATVEAAAKLWWDHGAVQVAAFALGTELDEVYERTMQNFGVVLDPTVELLQRIGTVPEANDLDEARRLVIALIFMTERNFYDLMRGPHSPAGRDELVDRLTRIWTRAFGVTD